MNKNGKTNKVLYGVGIGAILLVAIFFAYPMISQSVTTTTGATDPQKCGDSTGVLTVNAFNALQQGSNVTPTITVGVNGGSVTTTATSGTTTFAVGDKLTIFASLSDYIDTSVEATMGCGGLNVELPMYQATSDNPSMRIKNDDGDFMTDASAGGSTNQTALSAGETLTIDVEFQGTNLESSGNGIYIIELPASTSANVTDILMPGANKVSVPSVHTLQNAGSKAVAFEVPAVVGAEKKVYSISVVLGSGKTISGAVLTDWYAKQSFVDTDGTIKVGVEDSSGSSKYENTIDSDFYINAA